MERGVPDLRPARKARSALQSREDFGQAAALDAVVCGGGLPGERFAADEPDPCRWCGQPDTDWHRNWGCPHLASLPDPNGDIAKSRWVAEVLGPVREEAP